MGSGVANRLRRGRARRSRRKESQWRARFIAIASGITPYVAVEKDGALYFLPTRQKSGVDRFTKRVWKETRHLERALSVLEKVGVEVPRGTFVDVGAHIGTTAIAAVRRFGFDLAVALEPEQANYRLMRINLAANDLEARVRTFNVAASSRVGSADLKLRSEFGSKHRLVVEGEQEQPETVDVPLTTLDALAEDGSLDPAQTSLLWLDVEGHELEVLQGARRLVDRSVPIVMEFVPRRLLDGRLAALGGVLAEHYTHVLDLRPPPGDEPRLRPLADLEVLARHYERGFTDLLVFRSPAGHGPERR